ncbi:MAG TPA: sugar ABC transporter ATP-binding protein [Burkholderiaceae bacterium]
MSEAQRAAAAAASPILELHDISKQFPGVRALSEAGLRLYPGEVHALMGQNGAGKSTLIKIVTGVHAPDTGRILLDGKAIHPASTLDAQALGISTVYQEVNLCPNLSVAENIFIGRYPRRFGVIAWGAMRRQAQRLLERLNVDIDVTAPLSSFPLAIQQMVAIARALSISARVLILDEPTSSLDEGEVRQLFEVLRGLRREGMAILFVTHFLDQVYAISDRITVMRNGMREGEYLSHELGQRQLVDKMVGEATEYAEEAASLHVAGEPRPFLQARGLGRKAALAPLDIDVQQGELLGLAGLLGSGRTETARLLFGADRADNGSISIEGQVKNFASPRDAMAAGIGFCSEDRKGEGAILDLSVRENIILALQVKHGMWRAIPRERQREIAENYILRLGIRTGSMEAPIGSLSGGNQQKALLARWLATDPKMLILDEPTRGIDIRAKTEIMDYVAGLCRKGMAILFISSELPEVLRCSDRIMILRDRRACGSHLRGEMDQDAVLQAIAGEGA